MERTSEPKKSTFHKFQELFPRNAFAKTKILKYLRTGGFPFGGVFGETSL